MTAFPAAVLESAEKMVIASHAPPDDVLDAAAPAAAAYTAARSPHPAGNANMSAYHREFLQNCVEEAMDDFCSDLRRQMWHLHYDMVRSFQLQQGSFFTDGFEKSDEILWSSQIQIIIVGLDPLY